MATSDKKTAAETKKPEEQTDLGMEALLARLSSTSLEDAIKPLMELVSQRAQELRQAHEILSVQTKTFDRVYAELKTRAGVKDVKVKLNVGGTCFMTWTSTLTKEPSMLAAMFGGEYKTEPDDDGEYFIDRDPKHFPLILNWLRSNTIDLDGMSGKEKKALLREVQYYGVVSLLQRMEGKQSSGFTWDPSHCGASVTLSNENLTCAKLTGATAFDSNVLAASAVKSFTVKIDAMPTGNQCNAFIGFVNNAKFRPNAEMHNSAGFWYYLCNGTLYCEGPQQNGTAYTNLQSSTLRVGSVFKCTFDPDARTISYEIDGRQFGPAFRNVAYGADQLFPAISFYEAGLQMSLVPE